MNDRSEIIAKKKDGTEFLAEANISQVTVLGEKIYTVVLRDICLLYTSPSPRD